MAIQKVPFLDLSREYIAIKPLLLEAIDAVLSTQRFILGEEVLRLEAAVAARCGAQHAFGVASGTDALWLGLAAAGIGPGNAVVTSPFSFFSSVSSILRTGATPVLADIDPETFNLDPQAVRRIVTSDANASIGAILPVHLFGQTADWDGFTQVQEDFSDNHRRLLLFEDAAQAFGAAWKSRPVGSLGEAAAFSFYPTKNLGAGGDAGMVTTSNAELADRVRTLRVHGMRRRYYHEETGWNSRLDTIQAAILLVKLRFIDEWTECRRALARSYDELFQRAGLAEGSIHPQKGVVLPKTQAGASHVFHQYVIRVKRRDELRDFLSRHGVGSEIYYPLPLHLQPALRHLGYAEGAFPESELAAQQVLALPIYPQLTRGEQETVVDLISEFLT